MRINPEHIKAALLERMEDLAMHLYPHGRRSGPRWLIGDDAGSPGSSFSIVLSGRRVGTHGDFTQDERHSSSPLDLWMRAKGCDFGTALREAGQWAGVATDQPGAPRAFTAPAAPAEPPMAPVVPLSGELDGWLAEGLRFANDDPRVAEKVASWRGWPREGTASVIASGLLCTPLSRGRRVAAFPVLAPKPSTIETGRESQFVIGSHYRNFPKPSNERQPWWFSPSEKQEGVSIPPLPLVMGSLSTAKLMIVLEGEWDAVTLAIAEGWIEDGAWPTGVCVVGIRGASGGTRALLQHWLPFWPRDALALLICDNDAAGLKWKDELAATPCFLEQVRRRGTTANAISTNEPDKDIGDAYRGGRWPQGTIWKAIEAAGLRKEAQ
jgi:hypothetical protein